MRGITGIAAALCLAACAGGEGAEGCETFPITANVVNVDGEPVLDAIVELNNVECANNGDGSYTCDATYVDGAEEDLRAYNVLAAHGAYNSVASYIQLPENFCDGVPVDLQLGVMMGA